MIEEKINKVLLEDVNPELASHGGRAELSGIQDGVAKIKLLGGCMNCPSGKDTVELVVKEHIMSSCSEIKDVVLDTSVSADLLDMARKILDKSN